MKKAMYVKPSAVSLDDVSFALGATCTSTGSDGTSFVGCSPLGGDASNNCINGTVAGFRAEANCISGGTAKYTCRSGSTAMFHA